MYVKSQVRSVTSHHLTISHHLIQCPHLPNPGRTCRCPRGQCRSPHRPLPARGEAPCVRSHASLQQRPQQWEQVRQHEQHRRCWCCCPQQCPARLGNLQVHGSLWCQGRRLAKSKGPRPPMPCSRCFETWSAAALTAMWLRPKQKILHLEPPQGINCSHVAAALQGDHSENFREIQQSKWL